MSEPDYAKNHTGLVLHLRTIHFLLILLSVVVYIFSLSTSNNSVQRALVEYRELHKFVKNVDWDQKLIPSLCRLGANTVLKDVKTNVLLSKSSKNRRIKFWKKDDERLYYWDLKIPVMKKYYCEIDSPRLKKIATLISNKANFKGHYGFGMESADKPVTINQFIKLWNTLANGINIYYAFNVMPDRALLINATDLNKPFENKMVMASSVSTTAQKNKPGQELVRYRRDLFLTRNLQYEFESYLQGQQRLNATLFVHSAILYDQDVVLLIPVYSKVQAYDALAAFMEKYNIDDALIKKGNFVKSFPAIHKLLIDSPAIKRLDQLELFLREAEINPDNSMIIFNIKVNVNDLLYFGSILILALLLYFWLILRVLAYKLADDYHAFSAPWVGIFPDVLSFLLTALSVVLIPVTVSILQILRVFNSQTIVGQVISGSLIFIFALIALVVLFNYYKLFRKALSFARTLKTKNKTS